MKALSIIGIVLFSLCFLVSIAPIENFDDIEVLIGLFVIASIYGLALSIVGVVKSRKTKKNNE